MADRLNVVSRRFLAAVILLTPPVVAQGPEPQALTELSIEQLLDIPVQTATLKKQSLHDAPADVTVITAADIRRYGYRTLGEALSNVRGFYTSFDGGFQYAGVRGFSLPGDYNTRFLVMINGHHMTDNVYSAMYMFGQDFGLDMGLIEQIEIVRGPSSALYGSNGVFATINIITRSPGKQPAARVSAEAGSFEETKLIASATATFGRTGRALISASAFHTGGRTADLNPFGAEPQSVSGVGREQGFHAFANVSWNQWTFTGLFAERRVAIPTAYYMTDLGDTGTRSLEGRDFLELSWRKPIGTAQALKWRIYYDRYRYDGVYNYLRPEDRQNYDGAGGDWAGSQFLYEHETLRYGTLTLGLETNVDFLNRQYVYDVTGGERVEGFTIRRPNAAGAFFAQHEWRPAPAWTFYLGGRFDDSRNNPAMFSPRAAVVFRKYDASYKFTWGRAFRNPSTFERYYTPNPALKAEQIQSFEFTREQKLAGRLNWIATLFHYRLSGLIEGVAVDDSLEYRNLSRASATGFETELHGRPFNWLETTLGYTLHRVRGNDDRRLNNSPAHLGHFRASIPLAGDRLIAAGAMRYMSSRMGALGDSVAGAAVFDLTLTARPHSRPVDFQLGIRNLTDKRFADPLSTEHGTSVLPRPGRSFFVKLTWGGE
jgi:iron complex outermembrane receptor protein